MALSPRRSLDLLPLFRQKMVELSATPPRVVVACSGGPDSMALLDLVHRWRLEQNVFVVVVHVDHGLRPSSKTDAVFVQKACLKRGLKIVVRRVNVRSLADRDGRGIEDAARQRRYQALSSVAHQFRCSWVLTAHTLNDQAETFFINLLRGTGPAGLGAMAPRSPWPVATQKTSPRLFRPLLGVSKEELLAYLKKENVPSRLDPSNASPKFLRNVLRPLLQSLEKVRPGFFHRVAQTAQLLRDEEDFWKTRLGPSLRRLIRLERASFMRYHVAEQRRLLRHRYGLSRFDSLERVRLFVSDGAQGPLDIPGEKVVKTKRTLLFKLKKAE